jgi:type I restriction enzyme M protein
MALSLNKPKLDNLASDIWKSAERLRGKFKSYEYQSVILPIIVIRRLECVLIDWREQKSAEVRTNRPNLTADAVAKWVKGLELNPKQCPFSNRTDWTLRSVFEEDHALLEDNFRAYINGFSRNVDDIIEHFNYRATIGLMRHLRCGVFRGRVGTGVGARRADAERFPGEYRRNWVATAHI